LRIAIFSNCYQPMVNGVVGAITLLRKGFIEAGHEVYVFAPAFDDFVDHETGIYRYRSVDLTKEVKYPVAIPFSPRIQRIIDGLDLDIIHSHHPFVLGPLSNKIARRKRIPTVYTFHTQYEQYSHYIPLPRQLVNTISRHKITRFCESVNQVTTPAESARQILIDYGVTRPIRVIPNPTNIPLEPIDGRKVREQYHLGDAKVLINIGRIAPEKNLGLLLESFALMLRRTTEPLKLMIVGDGPELPALKQLAGQLGIAEQVVFTGMVEPSKVPDYLAAADLFVMTSKSEVKPLSQLEALAAGLPIIAVAAPGANDTIIHGENGYLVQDDLEVISRTVCELLADVERLSRFRKAARQSAERYSYPRIAAEYLEVYRETMEAYKRAENS